MPAQRPAKTREILLFSCFLAAMMLIGSLWDYPISLALYDKASWYGNLLAAYGEYPAWLGLILAGTMLIAARNRGKMVSGAFQLAGGGLLAIAGAFMAATTPSKYLPASEALLVTLGLLCSALTALLTARMCRGADRAVAVRVAAMISAVILTEIVLYSLIKIPWGRVRMRLVAADARAYFMPWWDAGGSLKKTLLAAGVAAEEFKSFPSGHTANAACLMLLCLLPQVNGKLAHKGALLFCIGAAWACMVGLSRIIVGAHYLTDTAAGAGLTLCVLLVAQRVFFSKKQQPGIGREAAL